MLGVFAMAVREGRFLREYNESLAEGTVQGTISHVVQAFRAKGRPNPTKDTDSKLSILHSRQFRAYQNNKTKQVQQKTLPFAVFDELAKRQVTELDRPVVQLTIIPTFFACCSCEYLKVPQRDMRHTKLLCLRSFRFLKDRHLISGPSDSLELEDRVAVTCVKQKNVNKHDMLIHRWMDDTNLCPDLQWSCLVNWMWTYPGTTEDTSVCTVWCQGRLEQITSQQVLATFLASCTRQLLPWLQAK
jgi:hypothetical protein